MSDLWDVTEVMAELGWTSAHTVYRRTWASRRKAEQGLELGEADFPLPEPGRSRVSFWDPVKVRTYRRLRDRVVLGTRSVGRPADSATRPRAAGTIQEGDVVVLPEGRRYVHARLLEPGKARLLLAPRRRDPGSWRTFDATTDLTVCRRTGGE